MMDTSRFIHLVYQHLPEFVKRKFSSKEDTNFASMSNIHENFEENYIYDADGCLLFMQTAQSNLSLFNISCDSLIFNETEDLTFKSRQSLNRSRKYSHSSTDIQKSTHRLTMISSEDIFSLRTNTLQRWKGIQLLNTSD